MCYLLRDRTDPHSETLKSHTTEPDARYDSTPNPLALSLSLMSLNEHTVGPLCLVLRKALSWPLAVGQL